MENFLDESNSENELKLKFNTRLNGPKSFSHNVNSDSIKILNSIDIANIAFKDRFELLFSDISMLKSSAANGLLKESKLRIISWMILLECIPFQKETWILTLSAKRRNFDEIQNLYNFCSSKANDKDHPLSKENFSIWNKHFKNLEIRELVMQDVIRM